MNAYIAAYTTWNTCVSDTSARKLGAKRVVGLEIDDQLVERSREIASWLGIDGVSFRLFDGHAFPKGETFDVVLSGHVIEHTPDPAAHLAECMAVLAPGGYLFLEFPSRYHWRELHTGRIGFEWLPAGLRRRVNTLAGAAAARIGDQSARHDRQAINTTLSQVSTPDVRRWLGDRGRIVARQIPRRRIVRLVIRPAG